MDSYTIMTSLYPVFCLCLAKYVRYLTEISKRQTYQSIGDGFMNEMILGQIWRGIIAMRARYKRMQRYKEKAVLINPH